MWDSSVRFSFGLRPPVDEQGAVDEVDNDAKGYQAMPTDIAPSPRTLGNQTAEAVINGYTNVTATSVQRPSTAPGRSHSFKHLSLEDTAKPTQDSTQSHIIKHSFATMTASKIGSSARDNITNDATTTPAPTDGHAASSYSLSSTASTGTPVMNLAVHTHLDNDTVAEEILRPVAAQLAKLRETTAANLPPVGNLVKAKSQIQLVKERLLPIGEFIVEYKNTLEQAEQGAMEMRLW
jgi:hypothetical protein